MMYAINVHTVAPQTKFHLTNNKKYSTTVMAKLLGTYERTTNTIAIPRPVLYSDMITVKPLINKVLT